jgi:hypothetical protein
MRKGKTESSETPKPRKPRAKSPILRVELDAVVTLPNGLQTTRKETAWQLGDTIYTSRVDAQKDLAEQRKDGKTDAKSERQVDSAFRNLVKAERLIEQAVERLGTKCYDPGFVALTVDGISLDLPSIRKDLKHVIDVIENAGKQEPTP